ncbi:peptidyl-prolyl cis-trans isomerase [Pseudoalteromonas fenneropenaei]|uniref:Peptidyl-prolyl cis-trans isomerase n=1 Tax=Pseudoalteromonas fenneropenaei TaxID=1737459 RepID=A0ABV7CMH5_9GAMM
MPWLLTLLAGLFLPFMVWAKPTPAILGLLDKAYQAQGQMLSKDELLHRVSENRFLLAEAHRLAPHFLTRQAEVGFSTQFHTERYMLDLLQHNFTFPSVNPLSDHDLATFDKPWLMAQLGSYPATGQYSADQLKQLAQVELQLPSVQCSLADIVSTLSMQMRFALHQGDVRVLHHELERRNYYRQIIARLQPELDKRQITLDALFELSQAEVLRPAMLAYLGVKQQMHSEKSPYLTALLEQVSTAQIAAYYHAHKADFRYVAEVEAEGASFDSQAEALAFREQLNQSPEVSFATLGDKQLFVAAQGRLNKAKSRNNWSQNVAFNLPPHTLSHPIRTPQGQWLLIKTGNRSYAYYDLSSETVRYQAREALLTAMAQAAYQQRFANWRQQQDASL